MDAATMLNTVDALGTHLSIDELTAELISFGRESIPLLGPPEGINADRLCSNIDYEVGEFEGVVEHD